MPSDGEFRFGFECWASDENPRLISFGEGGSMSTKVDREKAVELAKEFIKYVEKEYPNNITNSKNYDIAQALIDACTELEERAKYGKKADAVSRRVEFKLTQEIESLREQLKSAEEALAFYAERENLEINSGGSSINYDWRQSDWKIGPPYLVSAEFGQRARQHLERYRKK